MEVSNDELFRAPYDILSDANQEKLVKATFNSINSMAAISQLLGDTAEWEDEWGHKIHKLIVEYQENQSLTPRSKLEMSIELIHWLSNLLISYVNSIV